MNGRYPQKNVLGQLAIVLHAHLPYVRKNEKNSLEEDWLFQAILEFYIPLLQSIESSKNENPLNTKLTISLSPTLLSLLQNKKIQEAFNETITIPHSEIVESLNVACVAVPLLLERKRVAYTSK